MHAATEAIGMMASLTSFLLWLPQGARVWKHRHDPSHLGGIAASTQVISLAGNVLWGVYAVLIGSLWLGAPALVNGPIALGTIVVLRRGAARARLADARVTAAAVTRLPAMPPVVAAPPEPPAATAGPARELRDVTELRDVRDLVPA